MAITEPLGGTNVEDPTQHGHPIKTIATLDGNEWVIDGHKIWPSGAGVADITYCTISKIFLGIIYYNHSQCIRI